MYLIEEIKKILNKISFKNSFICSLTVLGVFLIDRFTKKKVIENLLNHNEVYINDFLNLSLVFNTGIGFGILSFNASIAYHLITLIIFLILFILIYLIIKSIFFEKILYSLILGGALGNLYDRVIYFAVPDFIDIHFKEYHWFTFNIADIFISLGVILLLLNEWIFKKDENK